MTQFPTCWFHMRPALSSRWHQRDWRIRVAAGLSSCTSACPSAGQSELSSALAWLFERLLRSKMKTHTRKSLPDTNLGKRFQGFYKKSKMIKSSVIAASCDVHELILNTSLTVTVMKWNVWVVCQQAFFSFLICPQWFPLSNLTFTPQGQISKTHVQRNVARKVY